MKAKAKLKTKHVVVVELSEHETLYIITAINRELNTIDSTGRNSGEDIEFYELALQLLKVQARRIAENDV